MGSTVLLRFAAFGLGAARNGLAVLFHYYPLRLCLLTVALGDILPVAAGYAGRTRLSGGFDSLVGA